MPSQQGPSSKSSSTSPTGPATDASSSDSGPGKDATVVVGNGKITVTVYEDFRCPPCKNLDTQLQPILKSKLAAGAIKVEYHAVTIVDHSTDGHGSLAAANAASCANAAGQFQAYHDALFAAQPQETDDTFAQPDKLIAIAQGVSGLDSPTFESCVHDQPYAKSVKHANDSFAFPGVPAILINGKQWMAPPTGDAAAPFTQALAAAGA